MQIKPLVLTQNTVLKDALRLMDEYGYGVLPVVKEDNTFHGMITDGDMRRALLNDQFDIEHVINTSPQTLEVSTTFKQRKQLLKKLHRRHLPIVDANKHYVEMFMLDEIDFNVKPNVVVLMAGGLGSRLGELTKQTPKPMLKVGSKPMLQSILETYIESGFQIFYFSVNYKKEQIIDYFGDGGKWGVEIRYLEEDMRLGTGGALSLIQEKFEHPFIVSNADVFTNVDYAALLAQHTREGSVATMCVRPHEHTIPYGVVKIEGNRIVSLQEKPTHRFLINSGVYVLNPEVLTYVPKNTFYDLPTLFEKLIEVEAKCSTFTIDDYWVDIGLVEEYESIREKFGY